jgi:hypothetical protein
LGDKHFPTGDLMQPFPDRSVGDRVSVSHGEVDNGRRVEAMGASTAEFRAAMAPCYALSACEMDASETVG